jgi:murein L,D-transpeptidase YafK
VRAYPVRLGPNPAGPKIFEMDGRTPEGIYAIDSRKRDSLYYRSLHISYPSPDDAARAAKYGIPPGGNIRIHGTPRESGRFLGDWTDGCIAVTNKAMGEIWEAVSLGTPIEIRP